MIKFATVLAYTSENKRNLANLVFYETCTIKFEMMFSFPMVYPDIIFRPLIWLIDTGWLRKVKVLALMSFI